MRYKVIFLVLLVPQLLFAQHPAFNLYPVNPLLINPAFTGNHGRTEVLLNYRQQWLGIENAPSVSTFQFDRAMTPQIALGVQAQRINRGAVDTNLGNILFAYKVLLGKHSSLNFGLSGGISSTGLNSSSTYNPADPAIQNLPVGEISPDLKFGTNYRFRGLNLGVSFTEMIPNRPYASRLNDIGNLKFYENYIVNLDYKFHFNSFPLAIQPFGVYYHDKYLGTHLEGGAILHYDDLLYLGGLYRQNYGAGILAGVQYHDFRLGYGYEIASNMVNQIGQGSHEVQLSFRFGKTPSLPAPSTNEEPEYVRETTAPREEPNKPEEVPKQEEEDETPVIVQQPEEADEPTQIVEVEPAPKHTVYYSGTHPNELPMGFYVIAGAFDNIANAQQIAKSLSQDGIFASTGYNSERKLYFVYVYRSDNLEKTQSARSDFRKKAMLKDAWLLEIR